jgi:hypothetical protein
MRGQPETGKSRSSSGSSAGCSVTSSLVLCPFGNSEVAGLLVVELMFVSVIEPSELRHGSVLERMDTISSGTERRSVLEKQRIDCTGFPL